MSGPRTSRRFFAGAGAGAHRRAGASEGGNARTSKEWGSVMSSSAPGASAEDDAERATRLKPRGRLDDGVAAHRSDAKPRTRDVGRGFSPRATRAATATGGRGSDATERARAAARSVAIAPERVDARPARSTLSSRLRPRVNAKTTSMRPRKIPEISKSGRRFERLRRRRWRSLALAHLRDRNAPAQDGLLRSEMRA